MPGPLSVWFETKDYREVDVAQKNLLLAYESDFAKHAPGREIPKLRRIWDSIPAQLGRENRKFLYGDILNIPLYCLFYMKEILDQSPLSSHTTHRS
jgi:hypothetical protein